MKNINIENMPFSYFHNLGIWRFREEIGERPIREHICVLENIKNDKKQLELLDKIFQAIKLNRHEDMDSIFIDPSQKMHIPSLIEEGKNYHIFLFGICPDKIGFNCKRTLYQWVSFGNVRLLCIDPVSVLSNSIPLKKKLWEKLKSIEL